MEGDVDNKKWWIQSYRTMTKRIIMLAGHAERERMYCLKQNKREYESIQTWTSAYQKVDENDRKNFHWFKQ